MRIKHYHTCLRNRKNLKKMGGVATTIQNSLKPHTVRVKEGEDEDEFLIIRLSHMNPPLNIVNIYGSIESRTDSQEILEIWGRLKLELDKIRERNEFCLLIGDLNRAIGAGRLGVKGNRPNVSYGGKLVPELLESGEYVLGNSSEKTEGGPWTWVSRADNRVKSCLDLVIMSADLAPYLKKILVDQKQKFAPGRARRLNGKNKLIFSDHYPLVVEFENLPKGWIAKDKTCSWNLSKPEVWEKHKELAEKAGENMDEIIENKELTIEEVAEKVEKIETKIKFQAFGKTKPPTKRKTSRRLVEISKAASRMEDEEDEKVNKIFKKQSEELEEDINNLNKGKFGRVTNVFKMAEIVGGAKKQKEDAHAITDPETKELVISTEEIKRISLAHCVNVLTKGPGHPDAELWVKLESGLHEELMTDESDIEANITKEDFNDVIDKFKRKNKPAYHFLTKAGVRFQASIFKLCKRLIGEEEFPKVFSVTLLKQLWKKKGSREDLNNNRFIHLKQWKP